MNIKNYKIKVFIYIQKDLENQLINDSFKPIVMKSWQVIFVIINVNFSKNICFLLKQKSLE